ncbi:hypothetical protein [Nocardia brasiliensis]|uniref:hypothetical protein n=1 Tax=Nocardia brasiliensis TaxID=37326 RepID=UPI00366F905F
MWLKDEQEAGPGKRGPTRLGFAVLLKYYTQNDYTQNGRFQPGVAAWTDMTHGCVVVSSQRRACAIGVVAPAIAVADHATDS